ncbi:MAG: type II secretion system F family protein [Gemmatimonadetes bacterium]|nr:type II secretion system F family protein [Gemmatimonadota bacterium]NIP79155.1 type II secretion system F family protein [Gemmatimonadota bacterium]NIU33757.1 type II secretion system F family protein [Gemmatimonadota bacterium]NIU37988.1 pilus assembly protein TadB [Gemmatimonadota bacterium]NIV64084.1 pilus assembly protein TadB [Gemmatimonadota bacterium]
MPRPDPWLLAAAAAFSAVLAVIVAFQAISALREWRMRRDVLDSLRDEDREGQDSRTQDSVVRAGTDGKEGFLLVLAERIPQLWDVQHLLVQSGLDWTLEGFAARVAAVATVLGVAALVAFESPALAGVAFVVGGVGPYLYVRWKKGKRIRLLDSQLPDAIDLIARAVRAGHPLSEGLRMAAEEAPEPLASEFRVTFEEQKFGLPFEEALLGLGDRVEIVDVRILITAILVQREVGGNLTEILEQIAETMRARFKLKRQVRVYTAQGRMSGYTLAALPILVGTAIFLINPSYIRTLFQEPMGHGLLVGAGILQGIGFLWIRRIVDVRY